MKKHVELQHYERSFSSLGMPVAPSGLERTKALSLLGEELVPWQALRWFLPGAFQHAPLAVVFPSVLLQKP